MNYPHVTEVLGILRKTGLEFWFKNNTAKFCNEESKKGLEVGKDVHRAIENLVNIGKVEVETLYPEEVGWAMKSFGLFRKEHPEIQLKAAEIPGTSEKYGYKFKMDSRARENNAPIILDWKTGKVKDKPKPPIYAEMVTQLSAYVMGYNEMYGAQIKKGFILVIAKDGLAYNLEPFPLSFLAEVFEGIFLPALQILNKQKELGGIFYNEPKYPKRKSRSGNGRDPATGRGHSKQGSSLPSDF